MARLLRTRKTWLIALALVAATAGLIISLFVFADSGQPIFTATLYSDVIRFEADGVASLRVTIYDLSENELWNSGLIMGDFVDWDRVNERGERLANGYYMYLAQGWDASDTLVLNKTGKVVLLPGDQVELRAAPSVSDSLPNGGSTAHDDPLLSPKVVIGSLSDTGIFGQVGIGTTSPSEELHLYGSSNTNVSVESTAGSAGFQADRASTSSFALSQFLTNGAEKASFGLRNDGTEKFYIRATAGIIIADNGGSIGIGTTAPGEKLHILGSSHTNVRLESTAGSAGFQADRASTSFFALSQFLTSGVEKASFGLRNDGTDKFYIRDTAGIVLADNGGNVGIGTTNATDKLTIEGSSGNLIACYASSSRAVAVFRVEADGDVHAEGTVYADAFVPDAGADVAERINVSEWVEAGDVVEIDPDHAGFFRKATGLYSRRVAGIISTSPGVILGNDFDPDTDKWDDNRPVLAIAGRVPVKVSTENGPIAVGDLLVSSSIAGVAMKGDPAVSIGAAVGKAMEPLESGEGVIMAQVMLR